MSHSFSPRLGRLLFVATLVAFGAPAGAQAKRDTCATMTSQFSLGENKTVSQARFDAANTQRSRLLSTLGVTINSTSQVTTTARGDSVQKVMQQSQTAQTMGTITRDSVIGWTTTDGQLWTMRWYGCAVIIDQLSDPKFWVRAHLDKTPPTYAWAGPARDQRDTILSTISVSLPSYITVLSAGEDDSLVVIYPSAAINQPDRELLTPNASMEVPPAGAKIRVNMEIGAQSALGMMIIIATKRDIPIRPSRPPTNPNSFWKMSRQEYLDWYNAIPIDQKAKADLAYQVQKVTRR